MIPHGASLDEYLAAMCRITKRKPANDGRLVLTGAVAPDVSPADLFFRLLCPEEQRTWLFTVDVSPDDAWTIKVVQ